jgi:hypothetical protein
MNPAPNKEHTMTTYEAVTLRDGKVIKLAHYNIDRGDHVDSYPDIMVRTRTGTKVHKGSPGSSVTNCGVWLRTNGSRYKVIPAMVNSANLCEKCYPGRA